MGTEGWKKFSYLEMIVIYQQSAAKVLIMITFDVFDRDGDPKDIKLQACIFKVSNYYSSPINIGLIIKCLSL